MCDPKKARPTTAEQCSASPTGKAFMPTLIVVDDSDTRPNLADLFGDLEYAIDTAVGGDIYFARTRHRP